MQSWKEQCVNLLSLQLICKFRHLTNNEGSKHPTFSILLKIYKLMIRLYAPEALRQSQQEDLNDLQIKVNVRINQPIWRLVDLEWKDMTSGV